MSIACIDWHPFEENILAATTLKTNRLEIWRVDQGAMICIMDLRGKTAQLKWNPHNSDELLVRLQDSHHYYLIDYKRET